MERRRMLSVASDPQVVERSPLIDPRNIRSCRNGGLYRSASMANHRSSSSSSSKVNSLKPISELGQPQSPQTNLHRSQSVPHYHRSPHYSTPAAQQLLRSPQYRLNPIVRFDDRVLPQRMNYGIAGYNTSRPRSFSSIPENGASRPRSFSSIPESSRTRPRSFTGVPDSGVRPRSFVSRSSQTPRPSTTKAVVWRSLTRRFRDKMGRIRVRDTCSKLFSRFRG